MKLYMDPINLHYFEALASLTRLKIIKLLAERDMDIKELAESLQISSSIVTKHIRKLEEARLITTTNVRKNGSRHKLCTLLNMDTSILIPFNSDRTDLRKSFFEIPMPVGQFTDIHADAPCGMADESGILGGIDEPVYLLSPERKDAQIVWMGSGYIEYTFPNYLEKNHRFTGIEIIGEFGSEFPGYNEDWPSSINIHLNGQYLCTFVTPGDFGHPHGALTPNWWVNNQYGILVKIRIDEKGLFINGERRLDITSKQLDATKDRWTLRFEAGSPSKKGGGLTIYGEKFGNYPGDLILRLYYV